LIKIVNYRENLVFENIIFKDYPESIKYMEQIVYDLLHKETPDKIIFTEYNHVITSGTSNSDSDLLSRSNIPIYETGRGGKHTYHGPGQRVIYPIINLTNHPWNQDLKKYLKFLHIWLIESLKQIGICAYQHPKHIGVWVNDKEEEKKIAAIGVRVRKWIVFHGAAVNISTNLENFNSFVPCGIRELGVTSIRQLGVDITMEEFDKILKLEFYNIIERV
jgi:lipoyl(octanoyl) transferase